MLNFYPVDIQRDLDRTHPLFVGNFFSLYHMWWRKRKERQGLIISIATAWFRLLSGNLHVDAGFLEEQTFITNLTRQVCDARIILDKFFIVKRIGFNFGNGDKSPSILSPKRLGKKMYLAVEALLNEIKFVPGIPPSNKQLTQSKVHVQSNIKSFVIAELKRLNREDLIPPVEWILKQESPITFYFKASGNLLARDTSVWPIRAIENWPGWLRNTLFGTVVDIENSYCQFLVHHLKAKYAHNTRILNLKYPDIIRADSDKQNFRNEILDLLKLERNDKNNSIVKKLIMSLANGSNATSLLMTNGSGRSEAVRIVREACPDLLPTELAVIGARLSKMVKQFSGVKRDLCIYLLKAKPSRINQKKIFRLYFQWEREARYKIWEACGKTGLHLHDGCDGVISDKTEAELASYIVLQTSVRVSVDNFKEAA